MDGDLAAGGAVTLDVVHGIAAGARLAIQNLADDICIGHGVTPQCRDLINDLVGRTAGTFS